jgi:thioredoxin-like negative regulator of GroEL
MQNIKTCILIKTEKDLEKILKEKNPCFILFYADWCPFSLRFLPIFETCAQNANSRCYRMIIDEHPHLCKRYSIEVYPTVIFFESGKVVKRLDGSHGFGLNEQQFQDLIKACEKEKNKNPS